MGDWIIYVDSNEKIIFTADSLMQICRYNQRKYDAYESGGILIGSLLCKPGLFKVTGITSPKDGDKQSRCSFFRSMQHNDTIQKIWRESKQMSTYVGLWHTHPESIPMYSSVDRKDWNTALNHSQYDGNNLLFLILGQTHIRCWLGKNNLIRNSFKMIGEVLVDDYME